MTVAQFLDRYVWRYTGGAAADEHRSILRGLAAVGVFAVLGRVAGAAKEIAVAWRYGVSAEVDAYLFVFNLINWPISVWFSVLSVVLIPMAATLQLEGPERVRRFRDELLGVTLGAGLLLALASLFLLPLIIRSGWVAFPPNTAALALKMVPVLSWVVLPAIAAGLYSTWMMSSGGHANTLFEGFPALGILVGVLIVGGIEPLIWGTLAGTVVQLAAVGLPSLAGKGKDRPRFSLASPHWMPFWRGFSVMMLGQAIMSLTTVLDQFLAARLAEGAISTLGYANRILSLVLGVVATAVTRSTLPVFSRVSAEGTQDLRRLARRWAGAMWLLGCVGAGLGWVLAPWGVRLLFERGTFTAADSTVVTTVLRFGLIQLPFYFSSLVFASLHSSVARYKTLLLSGVVGLTTKAIVSILLVSRYEVAGLMLAQAAAYGANTVLLARVKPR